MKIRLELKERKLCTTWSKMWTSAHEYGSFLLCLPSWLFCNYLRNGWSSSCLTYRFLFCSFPFPPLWLIPEGSKTNKWNLLLMGAIYLDKHPLRPRDSGEKYKAVSSLKVTHAVTLPSPLQARCANVVWVAFESIIHRPIWPLWPWVGNVEVRHWEFVERSLHKTAGVLRRDGGGLARAVEAI